jgi:uncharacterized membrane protein YqaE (UPF0057 family)
LLNFEDLSVETKENPMDCLRVILSLIIPPVGVFLQVGFGFQFWLNILLTLLGYIPGLVHAIWIIATR